MVEDSGLKPLSGAFRLGLSLPNNSAAEPNPARRERMHTSAQVSQREVVFSQSVIYFRMVEVSEWVALTA